MRPLTEYDPYDLEFTFWRERLHVDENNDYIITMLLSDYCLTRPPKDVEFNMGMSRPPLCYGNAQMFTFWAWFSDRYCPDSIPPTAPEDNKVRTPHYYARYTTYRYTDRPFDLLYSRDVFSEKVCDLNSDIVLNRVRLSYSKEYWSSCDPYYRMGSRVPDHPMVFITERIKNYDLRDNTCFILRDSESGDTFRLCLNVNIIRDRTVIPTPMFQCRRLDFWISDGNSYTVIPFCYAYSPGDAVTAYPYYAYIVALYFSGRAGCPMIDWRDMTYIPEPYFFGVGGDVMFTYVGFPAIGGNIIFPSVRCFGLHFLALLPFSLHFVLLNPTMIKCNNILWGV